MALRGKKFLVLRPEEVLEGSVKMLMERGAEVLGISPIKIVPVDYNIFSHELNMCIKGFYDWIIFTSANGVKIVMNALNRMGYKPQNIKGRIGVIGTSTLKTLKNYGLNADAIPEEFVGEKLVESLGDVRGLRVIMLRSSLGRREVANMLEERGAYVRDVHVYNVEVEDISRELESCIKTVDYVLLTSGFIAKVFANSLRSPLPEGVKVACIGPITAKVAESNGIRVDIIAKEHTFEGLIKEVERYEEDKEVKVKG